MWVPRGDVQLPSAVQHGCVNAQQKPCSEYLAAPDFGWTSTAGPAADVSNSGCPAGCAGLFGNTRGYGTWAASAQVLCRLRVRACTFAQKHVHTCQNLSM